MLHLLITLCIPAALSSAAPLCWRNGPQVNLARLLGRNDVVYRSPARYEHEALPVGNGRLCAVVWNADGLDLQLNHADNVWFQSSSGRVHLIADTGAAEFEERLSLYDGAIRTHCQGKTAAWTATTTVLAGLDVVAIHFEGHLPDNLRLELEQWRPTVKRLPAGIGFIEELPVDKAPQFSRRQALVVAADCEVTPGETITRNGLLIVPVSLKPRGAFSVYIANVFTDAAGDPAAAAAKALATARQTGWRQNLKRTAAAWREYWEKSFLYLTSPDGVADYMENLWFLHLYWMNCQGRGEFAAKFNGGLFLLHRDTRGWGSRYWYQNTRELYWPLLAANHAELCAPLGHLYRSVLPVELEMTKRLFKVDGAQYQETMAIDGTGDKEGNPYTCLYLTTGLEISDQLYRQYLYTRDEAFLKNTVWPILRETTRFYLNWVKREDDGLYHIYPTNGKETWWRVKDAITDLAALRRMFPVVIETSRRLGVDQPLAARCAAVLTALAPYPLTADQERWAPGVALKNAPDTGNPVIERIYPPQKTSHTLVTNWGEGNKNAENIECEVIFPWELVGLGSDANQLGIARKTYAARTWKQPFYPWDQSAVWAARLGLTNAALQQLVAHAEGSQLWPQGFWNNAASSYVAGVLVECPYFDPPGVNAMSTSEMLMQSWDGRIRVWPATPAAWNGAFRLRTQTGFMVASEKRGTEVAYVAVESLFGDVCRLVSPWPDEWRVTGDGQEVAQGQALEIVFPTRKGRRYLVERSSAPLAKMPFAVLAPPLNHDVKYLAGHDGPSMLGITQDGLTPVRIRIRENCATAEKAIRAVVGDRQPRRLASTQWHKTGLAGAPLPAASYVLELSQPATATAVVWSYDRHGVRSDVNVGGLKTIVVETSPDGATWKPAGETTWNHSVYGQPVPLQPPVETKWIRIGFRDQNGQPLSVPVDELEVF